MAFAGAIPDEDEIYPNDRAETAAYTTSSADPRVAQAARRPAPVAPEQRSAQPAEQEPAPPEGKAVTYRDVAPSARQAIGQIMGGITRIFGGQPAGGIPTEDDGARRSDGARRFAMGEGQATPDEVAAVDFAGGIDQVQADEGTKQLMRIDQVVQYHLMHGDKEKAEAAGVALLMRGASQVKQAGALAAAAFQRYQESGDPADLQNASEAIKRAHQLIPDGFDLQLDVDPRTHQMMATTVDSEGKSNTQVVDPAAVPGLLQQAMDGSAYWGAVQQLAQPELGVSKARSAASAQDAAARRAAAAGEWDRRHEVQEGDKIESEGRAAKRKLWEHENMPPTTAGERQSAESEAYLADWWDEMQGAPTPELAQEGLKYRYDNTPERRYPVEDDTLMFPPDSPYAEQFDPEDQQSMRNIARSIASRNATLDGPGAMAVTAILATKPDFGPSPDGTVDAGGQPLVFNPALLPAVSALRKKYVGQ